MRCKHRAGRSFSCLVGYQQLMSYFNPELLSLSLSLPSPTPIGAIMQLKFHEQQISASSSPVERCRRQLHVQTITAASISIFYCVLVIEDALRWCQAVLAFAEVPAFIGGAVLAGRMWGYT